MAEAERLTGRVAQQGRVRPRQTPAQAGHANREDPDVVQAMRIYDLLGADPPKIDVALNDAAHSRAHTLERHGPDVPLRHADGVKTVEGRIHGGHGWRQPENQSFKWDDSTVMTREINDYVTRNWEAIRSDLATDGVHEGRFDSGHRVGEGFLNAGMYGFGPRQAEYTPASVVRLRIRLVPGSDPPQPFLISAFPAGIV